MNPSQYTSTSWVQATCAGATGSTTQCTDCEVSPVSGTTNSHTGQTTSIGELSLSGKNGRETPIGVYEVAFSITIHQ